MMPFRCHTVGRECRCGRSPSIPYVAQTDPAYTAVSHSFDSVRFFTMQHSLLLVALIAFVLAAEGVVGVDPLRDLETWCIKTNENNCDAYIRSQPAQRASLASIWSQTAPETCELRGRQ
jgi:hypothetical protein